MSSISITLQFYVYRIIKKLHIQKFHWWTIADIETGTDYVKIDRKHSQASDSKVFRNATKDGKAAINEMETELILTLNNGFKKFTT